jgi:hypothetical protein
LVFDDWDNPSFCHAAASQSSCRLKAKHQGAVIALAVVLVFTGWR